MRNTNPIFTRWGKKHNKDISFSGAVAETSGTVVTDQSCPILILTFWVL
jgi:hypothetical protein